MTALKPIVSNTTPQKHDVLGAGDTLDLGPGTIPGAAVAQAWQFGAGPPTGATPTTPGSYFDSTNFFGYAYNTTTSSWVQLPAGTPAPVPVTATVFFTTADPNAGSPSFYDDPEDQAGSTNPALAAQVGTLYVSNVNGSTWIWNGAAYVTQVTPPATEWYYSGTTTDAGSNKVSQIVRPAPIGVGETPPANAWVAITKALGNLFRTATGTIYGLYVYLNAAGAAGRSVQAVTALAWPKTAGATITAVNAWASAATGNFTGNIFGVVGRVSHPAGHTGTVAGFSAAVYAFVEGAAWVVGATYGVLQSSTGVLVVNSFADDTGFGTTAPTANISVNGTANKTGGGTWAVFSDKRIKKNVGDYKRGLAELLQVRPVVFDYSDEYLDSLAEGSVADVDDPADEDLPKDQRDKRKADRKAAAKSAAKKKLADRVGNNRQVGVIAQEVMQVLPETVSIKKTNFLPDQHEFDANELTYTMINAIKELSAKVDAQAAEIAALKGGKV